MNNTNEKKCAVRFDDVCETQDWTQFNKAIALMDKYGIKPLLGVVPQNEDLDLIKDEKNESFWQIIKDLQTRGFCVAMHGYIHVYDIKHRGMVNKGIDSEFAGHPFDIQYEKIRRGKEILESHDIYTDTFFAPAHSYDRVTLQALAANGFKYISDGKSVKPYLQEGIKCIPCRFFGTPKTGRKGVYISVCHSSNWNEYPKNYLQLEKFCEENKDSFVSFDDLKMLPTGVFIVEKIKEKIYILFHDYIRTSLASNKTLNKIYHYIRK